MDNLNSTLVCGFYGNHNLGDEAMLSGIVQLLREGGRRRIVVLSNDPEDTRRKHNVEAIHISKKLDFGNRVIEMLRCRNFILGGGDLLRDSSDSSIALSWLKYIQTALALRRNTSVLKISVGEIWRDETKEAIPKILNQVQMIAVRDEKSRNKLQELGVNQKIHVIGDLALKSVSSIPIERETNSGDRIHIGVSVRHLVGRGRSINPEIYTHVLKEIVQAVDLLVDEFQAVIHYLPCRSFQDAYHFIDDDYVASLEALRFSRYYSEAIIHRYFDSAADFADKVITFDLVIGMRLHSLILSSAVGTPVIGIAYDSKVSSFMDEINQSENCISLDSISANAIFKRAKEIIQAPQDHRMKLSNAIQRYSNKLTVLKSKLITM